MKIVKLGRSFVVYGPDLKRIPGTYHLRQHAVQAYQKYYKEWDAERKARIYAGVIVEDIAIDEVTGDVGITEEELQQLRKVTPTSNANSYNQECDPYVISHDVDGEPLVTLSSGNVFEDLGLPDADKLLEEAVKRSKEDSMKGKKPQVKKKPIRRKPIKK